MKKLLLLLPMLATVSLYSMESDAQTAAIEMLQMNGDIEIGPAYHESSDDDVLIQLITEHQQQQMQSSVEASITDSDSDTDSEITAPQ